MRYSPEVRSRWASECKNCTETNSALMPGERCWYCGLNASFLEGEDQRGFLRDVIREKVEHDPNGGCWLWTGHVGSCGYGYMKISQKRRGAHRGAYLAFKGPIGEGLSVLHKCDVPCCVNPDHLFLGTNADNMADASRKGRLSRPRKLIPSEVRSEIIRCKDEPILTLAKRHGISTQGVRGVLKKGK